MASLSGQKASPIKRKEYKISEYIICLRKFRFSYRMTNLLLAPSSTLRPSNVALPPPPFPANFDPDFDVNIKLFKLVVGVLSSVKGGKLSQGCYQKSTVNQVHQSKSKSDLKHLSFLCFFLFFLGGGRGSK